MSQYIIKFEWIDLDIILLYFSCLPNISEVNPSKKSAKLEPHRSVPYRGLFTKMLGQSNHR